MFSRRGRIRVLAALILVEMGCLVVGLCIYHGMVVAYVRRAAEAEACERFAADAGPALAGLVVPGADRAQDPPEAAATDRSLARLGESRPADPGEGWVVTDGDWRVVADGGARGEDPSAGPELGERLAWIVAPDASTAEVGLARGTLAVGGRRHVALARALPNRDGYLVAHCPVDSIAPAADAIADRLPPVGLVVWVWTSTLMGFATYLFLMGLFDRLGRTHARTEAESLRRIQSLIRTRDALIFGLASVAESRDEVTGRHVERVSFYASRLAAAASHHPKFRQAITPEFIRHITVSAVLHDLGKVGIPDAILFKPDRLTDAERRRMQEHARLGGRYLAQIDQRLGKSAVIRMAREIALWHHERWDGQGYPDGLAGEQIPLAARIVSIADVYEALTSLRDYKPPFSHERCVEMIRREAGKQFDPDLVDAFLQVEGTFRQIAHQWGEHMFQDVPAAPADADSGGPRHCVGLVSAMKVLDEDWSVPAPKAP